MAAQSLPDMPRLVLLTRPAAASARFATAVRGRFGARVRVVISALMAPQFLHPVLPVGPFDALILTSETGAEAARRISAEGGVLPRQAFCVGDRTAEAALAAGFVPVSAGGDALALQALIGRAGVTGRLLHLRGADSRGDVAESLTAAGAEALSAVVYAQQPQPLSPEAALVLGGAGPVILPLFSPRSAVLFARATRPAALLWVAALSPAVADAATALVPARLIVAEQPDAAHLLETLAGWIVAGGNP